MLNAYTAYLNQVVQRLKQIEPLLPKLSKDFKVQCSLVYDNNRDYRLFSCLRNYSQHHKLPIHGMSIGSKREWENNCLRKDSKSRDQITVNPYFSATEILASKLKAKDRELIDSFGKARLDLKSTIRSFISSFALIQNWIENATNEVLESAERTYLDAYSDVTISKGEKASFLALIKISDGITQKWHLRLPSIERIKKERFRWRNLADVFQGSVSGMVVFEEDSYFGDHPEVWLGK